MRADLSSTIDISVSNMGFPMETWSKMASRHFFVIENRIVNDIYIFFYFIEEIGPGEVYRGGDREGAYYQKPTRTTER